MKRKNQHKLGFLPSRCTKQYQKISNRHVHNVSRSSLVIRTTNPASLMYTKATTGRLEERWRNRAFLPSEKQRQNMTTMVAYEAGRQAGASPSPNLPQSIPELQRQLTYPYQQTRQIKDYLITSGAVINFSRRGKKFTPMIRPINRVGRWMNIETNFPVGENSYQLRILSWSSQILF